MKSVYTSAMEMKDQAGLALLKLRLDPQSFFVSPRTEHSLTTQEKANNLGLYLLSGTVAAIDNFANEGSLSGKNLVAKPSVKDIFTKVSPRFTQYLTGLATTQNLVMLGATASICIMLAMASTPDFYEKASGKIQNLFDKAIHQGINPSIRESAQETLGLH